PRARITRSSHSSTTPTKIRVLSSRNRRRSIITTRSPSRTAGIVAALPELSILLLPVNQLTWSRPGAHFPHVGGLTRQTGGLRSRRSLARGGDGFLGPIATGTILVSSMLAVDNITKSFGARVILDRVTWSMNDDARVGLVGLNGAGKSTLLRLIAEVSTPDSGRIARPQKTRVGYLAQDAPEMSGRNVLAETLSALDRVQALDRRRREVEEILAREHSGPVHDSALAELGEILHDLERHDFYSAESRATAVLFGLGFRDEDLARDV